jgi:hypothetical protein
MYSLILAVVLWESPPPVAAVLIPFPLIGLAAGYAQARALQKTPRAFIEAETLRQVRAALKSSGYGKMSMVISLLNPFVMLGLALLTTDTFSLSTVIVAQTLFAFVRELLSLPGLAELRRLC